MINKRIKSRKNFIGTILVGAIVSSWIIKFAYDHEPRLVKPVKNEIYIVKNGDCISNIAEKYKARDEQLNNIQTRIKVANNTDETIYPGQKLVIPVLED